MSDKTKIEWTDATWNPVTGCTKVSQGCKHCYAERDWSRLVHMPAFAGRSFTDVACHPERLGQPLHWEKPRRIFVNSMSDLFHEAVPNSFIDQVFAVMAQAPRHLFQVLTKRPERMRSYLSDAHRLERWSDARIPLVSMEWGDYPLPNVWLGVSVEDQATADERITLLLDTPAAVRWISAEPLLGPVDLQRLAYSEDTGEDFGGWPGFDAVGLWGNGLTGEWSSAERCGIVMRGFEISFRTPKLDWVVVGGESGPNARPMHPDWARCLRDQCAAAGVPFLFKQWGEWSPGYLEHGNDLTYEQIVDAKQHEWPEGHCAFRVGKRSAGRMLDGVQHDGYPEVNQ